MGGVSNAAGLGSVQPSQQPQYNQQQGLGGVMQGVGGLANGVTNTIGGLAQQAYNQAMGNMPQQSQGFGPNVDNFAPQNTGQIGQIPQQGLGIGSGALQGLSQSPAMQTIGQLATGQQPVPEWIRLAMQSGNMNNPYANAVPAGLGSPQSTGGYPMNPQSTNNGLPQGVINAMNATPLGGQPLGGVGQTATPGAGLNPAFLAMTPEQRQAIMGAGDTFPQSSGGMPTRPPYPATSPFSPQNVNYQPKSLADVQQMMGNQPAPSQTLPQSTAQQPMSPQTQPRRSFNWADRFNSLRNQSNQQNLANLLRRR